MSDRITWLKRARCNVPIGCSPALKAVKLELPDNSKPGEEAGEQPIGTLHLVVPEEDITESPHTQSETFTFSEKSRKKPMQPPKIGIRTELASIYAG